MIKDRRLTLDFANTMEWRTTDHPEENLSDYADLVAWSRKKKILTEDLARRLLDAVEDRHDEAMSVFERAIVLREAIYRIVSAAIHGGLPSESDMKTLNGELASTLTRSRIAASADGFHWEPVYAADAMDGMLWSIVHNAADLLTSSDLDRVGECGGEGCSWLFLDKSRNRSRQWCSMDSCGNRAKARRFYERKRTAKETPNGART
jgi:predicted RNA-binding Zn ribbon-like protein